MQMDYETLSALCAQFQNGDEQAFAGLYEAMYGPMRGFALIRLAHDAHAAEDAVQDAFIEIYRGIGSLKDPQAFPKWANTILARSAPKSPPKRVGRPCWTKKPRGCSTTSPTMRRNSSPASYWSGSSPGC